MNHAGWVGTRNLERFFTQNDEGNFEMDGPLMTTVIASKAHPRGVSDDTDGIVIAKEHGPFVVAWTKNDSPRSTTSKVASTRIEDAEIPDWVHRRLNLSLWRDAQPAHPVRRGPCPRTPARVPPTLAGEPSVSDQVYFALARSGYPLQNVRCWCDDQTLTLSGYVTRYYYMQVAVEIAMALANGRRIGVSIEVVPTLIPSLSAD